MKYFFEPTGQFVIKIPTEWQYKNVAVRYKESSPFSFELYENSVGAFQISCYSEEEKPNIRKGKIQNYNTQKLEFSKSRLDDDEFNMHLWYTAVEDHFFIAKYIYDKKRENEQEVKIELEKVEKSLSTLELISPDLKNRAIEYDKYEKFMASLCASYDLKNKAIENKSIIELLIIIANQIDAFLRMAIVLKKQIENKTEQIDITLLFQGENDSPIMERKIYKQAKDLFIIDSETYNKLEELYIERNKVVHRYIITDFKTRDLFQIVYDYENISETVRLSLKTIEDIQYAEGIGIWGGSIDPSEEPDEKYINLLFSQVNDKHLMTEFKRQINPK